MDSLETLEPAVWHKKRTLAALCDFRWIVISLLLSVLVLQLVSLVSFYVVVFASYQKVQEGEHAFYRIERHIYPEIRKVLPMIQNATEMILNARKDLKDIGSLAELMVQYEKPIENLLEFSTGIESFVKNVSSCIHRWHVCTGI